MTTLECDAYLVKLLDHDRFVSADPSQNGLQITNSGKEIKRAAFAVDACLETIERAAAAQADILCVHHGLFWKDPELVTGIHYRRIKTAIDSDLALFASHLPLDAHGELGNNMGLLRRLKLDDPQPFGDWRGVCIGWRGLSPLALDLDTVIRRLFPDGKTVPHILPFGPRDIRTIGIISGGAAHEANQAAKAGCDLFITGEISHELYHYARENRLSILAAGHYQTETVGIQLLAAHLGRETGIDTLFIDVPTGL